MLSAHLKPLSGLCPCAPRHVRASTWSNYRKAGPPVSPLAAVVVDAKGHPAQRRWRCGRAPGGQERAGGPF